MARRMFSPEIVTSDKFLDMPTSCRELYFQLGMAADDDGFVSPRRIMRMVGASEDDLKILIGKKYVIPFESGVVVVKHWKVNNLVRKDWYRPTTYQDEKSLITHDNGGVYYLVNEFVNIGSKVGSKEIKEIPLDIENTKKQIREGFTKI